MLTLPDDYKRAASRSPIGMEVLSPLLIRADEISANLEPFFFPEYTDHSTQHIEDVLATCIDLVHDEADAVVSDTDYCILALSAILHDVGLHLKAQGFLDLIKPTHQPVANFDAMKPSWARLWEDFLAEAARFDERRLTEIFSSAGPIRRPPLNPLDWSLRDRLLIGEFLRRHHPRLSHEIAIRGFPIGNGEYLQLLDRATSEQRDLIGLIARSHGIAIRDTLSHIDQHFDRRDYNGTHIIYLMVLLRIADYLQIQPSRAPSNVRNIRRIQSPLSNREWRTHASIKNISVANIDPEAIEILAEPPDVKTYLRVRDWLDGIQAELDLSWAILGETYGRFSSTEPRNNLTSLKLKIRRIKSNMDDLARFSQTVIYLPQHVTFGSAGSDLLKLLIGPLYNYQRLVGVRELFQNATDAVRELDDILAHEPDLPNVLAPHLAKRGVEIDLTIRSDGGISSLEIRDSGVGMNIDVITKYFLTAGASFRDSLSWRKLHEEGGHSRVARGGRFGIGVLAAFLLGRKIGVHTRHYAARQENSIYFEAAIGSPALELTRKPKQTVGTSIFVELSTPMEPASLREWLDKNLFESNVPVVILNFPNVHRKTLHKIPRKFHFAGPDFFGWSDSLLSVGASIGRDDGELIVNSIKISHRAVAKLPGLDFGYFRLKPPRLIVWDRDGIFPLNLQRDMANYDTFIYKDKLIFVTVTELLAKLYAYNKEIADTLFHRFPSKLRTEKVINPLDHFETSYDQRILKPLAIARSKLIFSNNDSLIASNISKVIVIAATEIKSSAALNELLDDQTAICMWQLPDALQYDSPSKYLDVIKFAQVKIGHVGGKVLNFILAQEIFQRLSSFKRRPAGISEIRQFKKGFYANFIEGNEGILASLVTILMEQHVKPHAIFELTLESYKSADKYSAFMRISEKLLGMNAIHTSIAPQPPKDDDEVRYFMKRFDAHRGVAA